MKASKELVEFVEELRHETAKVAGTHRPARMMGDYVDREQLTRLVAGCRLLIAKLGLFGKVWDEMLAEPESSSLSDLQKNKRGLGRNFKRAGQRPTRYH